MKKLLLSLILTFVLLVSSVMAVPVFSNTAGLPTSIEVGDAYSGTVTIADDATFAITQVLISDSNPSVTFTISPANGPASGATYTVSGSAPTCTDESASAWNSFTITATNSNGDSTTYPGVGSLIVSVLENAAPNTLVTASVPSATMNVAYSSQQITVSDAESDAVTFGNVVGLPAGMSLSASGVLSGTPTAEGTFNIQFAVGDACNPLTSSTPVLPTALPLTVVGPVALLAQYQAQFNNLTTILDGYEDTLQDTIEEDIDDACEDRDEAIEDADVSDQDNAEDDLDDSVEDLEDLDDDLKDLEDEVEDLEDDVDALPSSTAGQDALLDDIEEDLFDEIDDLRSDVQSNLEEAESYCEVPQPATPDEPETSTPAAPVVVQPQPSAGVVTQTASQTVPVQQSSPKEQVAVVSTNSAPQPQPSYPSASRVVIDSSKQQGTTNVWMIAGFSVLAVLLVVLLIVLAVALFRR